MQQPPIIARPASKRRNRTLFYILLPLLVVAFAVKVVLFGFAQPKRPTESELLQAFQRNRAAFEQLRDMFRADDSVKLRKVADWGIETRKPIFMGKPTTADFPMERYQQYLRLLHQVGSTVAFRNDYQSSNPTITIWEAGWFANWRHIDISWMDAVPTNQVTNIDQCRTPKRDEQHFYKHIDEQWYLDTDMRPF